MTPTPPRPVEDPALDHRTAQDGRAGDFSLDIDLPAGLTVIEASAGTGKTYTLAALFVREIAWGRARVGEICVVTFTEAATAELKGRLRERLTDVLARLEGRAASPDPFGDGLAAVDATERTLRHERVQVALAEFDAATISTIHGFCQRLLTGAGDTTGADPTRDDHDISEVVTDLILARCHGPEDLPGSVDALIAAVRLRLAMPDARLAPVDEAQNTIEFVDEAVAEVRRRRRDTARRSFDAMLADARDLVTDPRRGPSLVADLRHRFRLVLIDEFQDTDQVQWSLFKRAFVDTLDPGPAPVRTVIVGDPKQAIYRFRGAELAAYLSARRQAENSGGGRWSLGTNYRSDPALLQALATLFEGATFGDPAIAFSPVTPGRTETAGASFPDGSAMQIRVLTVEETAEERHRRTGRDLIAQVVDTLRNGRLPYGDGDREVRPSDLGILVRSNDRAAGIVEDLAAVGVPAVAMGRSSVLESPAASQWQMLIGAMQRPSRLSSAKTAAVGWFGAWELDAIAHRGDSEETAMLEWVGTVVDSLVSGGVPAMLATLRRTGFATRLLARPGGERDLTDVEHIAELLQIRTGGAPTTPDRLNAIMTELRRAGDVESSSELFDRRIDRDDDTVKVLTIHKAKGLEFPIVFCPDLWSGMKVTSDLAHAVHPELDIRLIDTTAIHPGGLEDPYQVAAIAEAEQRGEATRVMYVAFTRPRHRLVIWAAPGYSAHKESAMPFADRLQAITDGDLGRLDELSDATIAVVPVPNDPGRVVPLDIASTHADLEVATIDRLFDRSWRVWSYSGIERVATAATASVHGPGHGAGGSSGVPPAAASDATITSPPVMASDSEDPEIVGGLDEPLPEDEDLDADVGAPAETTLASVPGGPTFGTAVHALLEEIDFASPTLETDLVAHSAAALALRPAPISATALAAGLHDALTTPLGGPLGTVRLVDLTRRDRLDELDFHLPLGRFQASDLAAVVRDGLEPGDTLAPWFDEAARSGHEIALEGYLTGSIDLVARVEERYFIADYKTNRLDGRYDDLAMTRSMIEHAYPLQAVIYLVAVHRHLRTRLAGYDPDANLVGASYLFLRGMRPDAATGVRWWRPPTRVLAALDELFTTGVTP